jgi:hypothetical protein
VQSAGIATADNHRIGLRDCLAGSLGQVTAKLSQGEGIRIQIPLEHTAELREEGVDQNLLVPGAHLREGAAKPRDQVAHHHELSKQLVGSRHLAKSRLNTSRNLKRGFDDTSSRKPSPDSG